jgi:hypothetical protein
MGRRSSAFQQLVSLVLNWSCYHSTCVFRRFRSIFSSTELIIRYSLPFFCCLRQFDNDLNFEIQSLVILSIWTITELQSRPRLNSALADHQPSTFPPNRHKRQLRKNDNRNSQKMRLLRIHQLKPLNRPLTKFNRLNSPTTSHRNYSVHPRSFDDTTQPTPQRPKVTLANLRKMYMTNQKLAVMTAYDYPSGTFADRAGSDIVLVGDSLGMVCLGYESTNLVTLSVYPSLA